MTFTATEDMHRADCNRADCDHEPFVIDGEIVLSWNWCAKCREQANLSGAWNGTPRQVWADLEELLNTYDSSFRVAIGSASYWAGELRLTLTNPPGAPSRSITFYSVAGWTPEDVAIKLLYEANEWLGNSGVTPMPVPDWRIPDG